MKEVLKTQNPADIERAQQAYWREKTPEERLAAAKKLILRVKALQRAAGHVPSSDGDRIFKSNTPIQRGER